MPCTTLVDAGTLREHLEDPDWMVVDCRFSLDDPEAGGRAYAAAHIPGAVYAHLDRDLSGPVVPGVTGRHPLPDPDRLSAWLSARGVDASVQVVAYDNKGGAIAARLWMLLRWLGHAAVAVLDGGWSAWCAAGHPTTQDAETPVPRQFIPAPASALLVDAATVERLRNDPACRLLDARARPRYRGEVEPIDPVAGHIPGAVSAPFAENLAPDGRFLPPEELRARFKALLGGVPPSAAVCYCGSGVTANHILLAMEYAGLPGARLYAGSWSEWITDPSRPVATGEDA